MRLVPCYNPKACGVKRGHRQGTVCKSKPRVPTPALRNEPKTEAGKWKLYQNRASKANDMVDKIIEMIAEQRGAELTANELNGLANNIDVIVHRFGDELAFLTGRPDPPSPSTQRLMGERLAYLASEVES